MIGVGTVCLPLLAGLQPELVTSQQAADQDDLMGVSMADLCEMGVPIKDVMPMDGGSDLRFLVGDLTPRYPLDNQPQQGDADSNDTCGW